MRRGNRPRGSKLAELGSIVSAAFQERRALVSQQVLHRLLVVPHRVLQGRAAEAVLALEAGIVVDQQLHHFRVPFAGGEVQGGATVVLRTVDVHLPFHRVERACGVPPPCTNQPENVSAQLASTGAGNTRSPTSSLQLCVVLRTLDVHLPFHRVRRSVLDVVCSGFEAPRPRASLLSFLYYSQAQSWETQKAAR